MSIARQFLHEFRPLFRMLEEPITRSPAYFGHPSRALDGFIRSPLLNQPALDVTEQGNKYVVEADIPGVKKENLEVRIGDGGNSVTIQGRIIRGRNNQRTDVDPANDAKDTTSTAISNADDSRKISVERSAFENSTFTRTVWLPKPVDSNAVKANLSDGVLTITLDKLQDKASVVVPVD